MSSDDLVALVCSDLGAIVRGRSVFASELEERLKTGVGWVPANHALTPLGPVAEPNPFGSTGDLRLLGDPATHVRVEAGGGVPALELVLCDIVELDGQPWECCPRSLLAKTLEALERERDIHVHASFEHEFQLVSEPSSDRLPVPLPFSLEAQRSVEPFATDVMRALLEVGVQPERFFAEYAAHQFEIPVRPTEGLASADRSVIFKEVVREIARRHDVRASFAPLLDLEQAGNGTHIHLDLLDGAGQSLLYDPREPAGLSELGSRFAAGILEHASALSALSAPSPVSAARLRPHRWSAGAVCLAERGREALLRIPPVISLGGADPAGQFHLEYRGADATANPYLALAAIVRAGLEGLDRELPAPPILQRDPGELDGAEARRYGVGALPSSLQDAMDALAADEVARDWIGARLYDAYVCVKRAELQAAAEVDPAELCRRYGAIY